MARNWLCVIIALSLSSGMQALAASWYVNSAASGDNSGGSWANAWKSFSQINWGKVNDGDTLFISGGTDGRTYNETLAIPRANATSEANRIYIRVGQESGHNGKVTITSSTGPGIKLGTDTEYPTPFSFDPAAYVTVDGEYQGEARIVVKDCFAQGVFVRYSNMNGIHLRYLEVSNNGSGLQENGIRLNSGKGTIVEHCIISGNEKDGINLPWGIDEFGAVTVRHCQIKGNKDDGVQIGGGVDFYNNIVDGRGNVPGEYHPDAIQGSSGYWRIYNNIFNDHTQEVFIQVQDGDGSLTNIFIYNNVFYEANPADSSVRVILSQNSGLPDATWGNIHIANNTFTGGPLGVRFLVKSASSTVTLVNSTIENNVFDCSNNIAMNLAGEGKLVWSGSGMIARNNLFIRAQALRWGTHVFSAITDWQTTYPNCTGNFFGAVTFRLSTPSDYYVVKGDSINRGVSQTLFSSDRVGVGRPDDGQWDIGAFETIRIKPPSNLRVVPE